MFKQLFSTLAFGIALGAVGMLTACTDEENPTPPTPPVKPANFPTEVAEAARAEVIFVEGHLHGLYGFHANVYPKEMRYIGRRDTLRYTLDTDNTWKADASNPKQLPLMGSEAYPPVYAILVNYYDKKGNILNGNVAANDKQFQTFYYLTDIRPTADGKAEESDQNGAKFFQYMYCDTTPWDKTVQFDRARLTGPTNPVGLKGYLRFNKVRKLVTLNIHLMKTQDSKFIGEKDGEPITAPYYAPTEKQKKEGQWLSAIQIPINLYMDTKEKDIDDLELNTKESELSSEDLRSIHSMMRAFGITFEQAVSELYYNLNGKRPPHNNHGGFWF